MEEFFSRIFIMRGRDSGIHIADFHSSRVDHPEKLKVGTKFRWDNKVWLIKNIIEYDDIETTVLEVFMYDDSQKS